MNPAREPLSPSTRIPAGRVAFDHILGRQYTVFDGLAGMHVEDIYQDRRGVLWIATADGGVSRYDGARFETFGPSNGLPHLNATTIAEEEDGRLLFGTLGGGLAAFDGQGFQVYTSGDGLPSNDILSLHPLADGSVQVLTGNGIARFVDGKFVEPVTELAGRPIGAVYDMATDAAGTTWLASRERGVVDLEGQPMNGYPGTGETAIEWPWKFAPDAASGGLWIAFQHVGSEAVVGRYDPERRQLDLIEVDHDVERGEVVKHGTRHVRRDDRSWLWMSRRGVLVYDGQAWHPFSVRLQGTHFSDTRLTYEDREGNIWVGLWGGGLLFCDPVSVQLYTQADGLPDDEVRCLDEDGTGRLWIGTMGGLACREEDRIRTVNAGHMVSGLATEGPGPVWSESPEGRVFQWTEKESRTIDVAGSDSGEEITALCADGRGQVWAGTSRGRLGRIEAGRFNPVAEGLPHECRAMMPAREGALWVGTGGPAPALYRYEEGRFQPPSLAGLEAVSEVTALCEHQGQLWVGTANSGLFALDFSTRELRRFTVDRGDLSVNGILSLVTDPEQDCLWVGTSGGGVLRYDGHAFLTIRLGNAGLENVVEAILRDSAGRLWFGTRAGLVAYRPGKVPPALVIREVEAGRLFEVSGDVTLLESAGEIRIELQGISFRTGAEQMRYSHRLAGHAPAQAWSEFTSANSVSFSGLPAGPFRFEVRTMDRDGLISEAVSLEVQVVAEEESAPGPALEHMPWTSQQKMLRNSSVMSRILERAERVADTDTTVLILGETGVGKGVLAKHLHALSRRRERPFVSVNCGGLASGLVESELFGHEKGAFTDAAKRTKGRFEQAHEGTLFLDEVGDLPPKAQTDLLQVLDDKTMTRVGGEIPVLVDVRMVAATNRDLKEAMDKEEFRKDLFHRLNVFPIIIPPLRDRREEIPLLADYFASRFAREFRRPVPSLSPEVLRHFQEHPWPGNVRELEHVMQRALLLCRNHVVQLEDVLPDEDLYEGGPPSSPASAPAVDQGEGTETGTVFKSEKQQILEALQAAEGAIYGPKGAAALLGMNPERLRSRMRVYELKKPKKRS